MRNLIAGLFVAGLSAAAALAQPAPEITAEEIVEGLTPAVPEAGTSALGASRGVCIGTTEQCAAAATTGASGSDSTAVAAVTPVMPPPTVNLLITFQFGSDQLTEQAEANLREFARAIRLPALEAEKFTINGHTDAVGSDTYNDALSMRRARTVVGFLASLGINPSRLRAVGYGERVLYDPSQPDAAINRRVEAAIDR